MAENEKKLTHARRELRDIEAEIAKQTQRKDKKKLADAMADRRNVKAHIRALGGADWVIELS